MSLINGTLFYIVKQSRLVSISLILSLLMAYITLSKALVHKSNSYKAQSDSVMLLNMQYSAMIWYIGMPTQRITKHQNRLTRTLNYLTRITNTILQIQILRQALCSNHSLIPSTIVWGSLVLTTPSKSGLNAVIQLKCMKTLNRSSTKSLVY